jgi:hypothetical protein
VDRGTYCIGGPAHSPHVIAQIRLAPGDATDLDLSLEVGSYWIASRSLARRIPLSIREHAPLAEWEIALGRGPDPSGRALAAGRQRFIVENHLPTEALVRVERRGAHDDAVTAAEAMTIATFREGFPNECLARDQLIATAPRPFLAVELADPSRVFEDERAAFAALAALHELVAQVTEDHGGGILRLRSVGFVAAFEDPLSATRAGAVLLRKAAVPVRIAIDQGRVLATTIERRLDYFGRVLVELEDLLEVAEASELVLGETVATLPSVHAFMRRELARQRVVTIGTRHVVAARATAQEPAPNATSSLTTGQPT